MEFSQLTPEQMRALPPQVLKQLYDEHQASQSQAEPVPETAAPQGQGYSDTLVSPDMHPNMSKWDRWVVKNLASSPDAGAGYLRKHYPDMDFRKTRDGEIVMKGPNDQHYYRLDEKDFTLTDWGDIVADVGQGAGEAAMLTAAGVSATNPLTGTLTPAFVAGSGMVGAAGESLKQGVGSLLGIPNNANIDNVRNSAIASMAMPVLGQAVRSGWQVAKKAAPKVASFFSDIPENVIKNINADKEARKHISERGVTGFSDDLAQNVQLGMNEARAKTGKAVGEAIGDSRVNIEPAKQDMAQYLGVDYYKDPTLANYMGGGKLPNATTSTFSDTQRQSAGYIFNDIMDKQGNNVMPMDAINLKNRLYGISQGDKSQLGQNALQDVTNEISPVERMVAGRGYDQVKQALFNAAPDKDAFRLANNNHSNVLQVYSDPRMKVFNDTGKTQKFLSHFDRPTKKGDIKYRDEFFNRVADTTSGTSSPVNLPEKARQYQSWEVFDDPSMISPDNKTKAAGWGSLIGTGLGWMTTGNAMGGAAGAVSGGVAGNVLASPWMIKKAAESAPVIDASGKALENILYANPWMRNDKAMINLMMNENNR